MSANIQRYTPAHKDSMSKLGTALAGVTTYTFRQFRNTGIVLPHIAKNDVFSDVIQINHDKELGQPNDDYHIHFSPVGAVSGGEVISIDYAWGFYTHGDTIPDILPNTGTTPITLVAGDQYKLKVANIVTNITAPANEGYSSFVLIKCQRRNDGTDTYAGEIALWGQDSHYPVNRNGSLNDYNDNV